MSETNLNAAVAYYKAMHAKDLSAIEQHLHPDVQMISPLAQVVGKEAVLNSIKNFLPMFQSLTIRAKCGSGNQAMLAYDLDCPAPFEMVRGAVLLTFEKGLIKHYELFYDARPFVSQRDDIFASS